MPYQSQAGHRREVVVELFDDQLPHGTQGLGSIELYTPIERARMVIRRQHQPYLFLQLHQRLGIGKACEVTDSGRSKKINLVAIALMAVRLVEKS